MVKNHLKRLSAPRRWRIARKRFVFVKKSNPGPHDLETSVPLLLIMRDMLGYANTAKEARSILQNKNILVNGIRRKELGFPVGLFDVIEVKELKEYHRVILDSRGKISLIKIEKSDADIRPVKITGKSKVKGKVQLNFFDGTNMLIEKDDYKTGDTLIFTLPKNEIQKKFAFGKKAVIFLTGGKHIGEIGTIEDIRADKITYKIGSDIFETSKEYAFIIGEDKPSINITK